MSLHEPPPNSPESSDKPVLVKPSPEPRSEQGARRALQQFPQPSEDAIHHSKALIQIIKDKIAAAQGVISFSDYMFHVLMEPGLGYYSAGAKKFGAAGDFITAPETSVLFAHCIARQCEQVLTMIPQDQVTTIMEIGAGTGRLAAELLLALESVQSLPQQYLILEPSADLQAQQKQTINDSAAHLLTRVCWISSLPNDEINGVIIGNEVLDVLPVKLFDVCQGDVLERCVSWHDERFCWHQRLADKTLKKSILDLGVDFSDGYQSEINPSLGPWVKSIAASLQRGLILLIDYGYPRQEYYHSQRNKGSLLCHYRHRAHPDPFVFPGLQDITAHVDFTAVAEAAFDSGLHVAGYNTQGQFLLCCGIDDLAESMEQSLERGDDAYRMSVSQQIKRLILPSEMGEIFKVIALTRGIDEALLGFSMFDLRGKL